MRNRKKKKVTADIKQTEAALTHSRSVTLSIFMKSCLARSKISGSSLGVICNGAVWWGGAGGGVRGSEKESKHMNRDTKRRAQQTEWLHYNINNINLS